MALYKKTIAEIASFLGSKIMGGKKGCDNTPVYRIEYDSRKVSSTDIFVCLTGHNTDGHKYASMAYDNGCRVFLCEYDPSISKDAAVIIVDDTRAALASLSAYFYDYPADKLNIIGITGTKGKTTTALLVSSILNKNGKNCAYIGSNGVIINGKRTETVNTTPESRDLHHYFALMVDSGVKYAALEVSSQALAHHRVDGINFAVKVFTNLSPDHIGDGEHKDFEEYKAAKASFFTGYTGTVICNTDDPETRSVTKGVSDNANIVSFGLNNDSVYCGSGGDLYRDETTLGIEFFCKTAGEQTKIKLRSPGAFSIYNGLAAIAVANQMGVDMPHVASALSDTSVMGRFEIVPGLPGRTFIVDYAHNGESMRRALTALKEYNPSRLIVVFGSVGGRTQSRRSELAVAASNIADLSIISSDNPDYEDPMAIIDEIASHMKDDHPYLKISDREEAVRKAVQNSCDGDIVLFAGKGHETYQLVHGKKVPFVEREIIEDEVQKILSI